MTVQTMLQRIAPIIGGIAFIVCPPPLAKADDNEATSAALFQSLDRNQDGVVEPGEVSDDQQRFLERLVRVGDKNQDGRLSRDEFLAAMRETPQTPAASSPEETRQRLQDMAKDRFRQLDTNRDGKLTAAEFPESVRPDARIALQKLMKDSATEAEFFQFSTLLAMRVQEQQIDTSPLTSMFQRIDQDKNGKLTLDEIPAGLRERMEKVFEAIGKRELTIEEFRTGFNQVMEATPSGSERSAVGSAGGRAGGRMAPPPLFRVLDLDRDGRLSKEELSKAVEHFEELDSDQDGFLSAIEVLPPLRGDTRAGHGAVVDQVDRVGQDAFSQLDKNGDGTISRDEAPPRLKELFLRIDINNDNALTPSELRRAFERGIGSGIDSQNK